MKLALSFQKKLLEAGVDEVGRGCLAGPVVAAAVILDPKKKIAGLNDSKKLTEKARFDLAILIKENAIAYAIGEASMQEIDDINILQASFLAMHRAIEKLEVTPQLLSIDGNRFRPFEGIEHQCFIKGDGRFQNIAAASIMAKTHRDSLMDNLDAQYPMYGWKKNKGYPTIVHRAAIKQYGVSPQHRLSFKLLPQQIEII